MKKLAFVLVMLIICLAAENSVAQSQKEKDRSSFISNAKMLEKKPFDPNAADARSWGFKWLVDTDDVSVALCSDTMKLNPGKEKQVQGGAIDAVLLRDGNF
jgi:hypothetical protein